MQKYNITIYSEFSQEQQEALKGHPEYQKLQTHIEKLNEEIEILQDLDKKVGETETAQTAAIEAVRDPASREAFRVHDEQHRKASHEKWLKERKARLEAFLQGQPPPENLEESSEMKEMLQERHKLLEAYNEARNTAIAKCSKEVEAHKKTMEAFYRQEAKVINLEEELGNECAFGPISEFIVVQKT